ncbi:hypothetical protein BaRGS_00023922 [Batillaria attramentaria]|uniref:Uncharacterized protein n=1 Tax=Batillaria attramentaria TaxID=370345 RepID=A0ABD0KCL4_9CAEN
MQFVSSLLMNLRDLPHSKPSTRGDVLVLATAPKYVLCIESECGIGVVKATAHNFKCTTYHSRAPACCPHAAIARQTNELKGGRNDLPSATAATLGASRAAKSTRRIARPLKAEVKELMASHSMGKCYPTLPCPPDLGTCCDHGGLYTGAELRGWICTQLICQCACSRRRVPGRLCTQLYCIVRWTGGCTLQFGQ